jgi:predicted MPP superfamily phosphohydrolase
MADRSGCSATRRWCRRFGNRYAYGDVVEDDRHLIVSGGLGFSILPIRFGVRPEILSIELG